MSADLPRVLVVIVNYRTGPFVVESLRALAPEVQACPGTEVLVVDNCSGDDSVPVIEAAIDAEGWSGWVRLMRSGVNGGFSYGNNCAIRPALASSRPPDYVWLLNPDTEVRPGALRRLLDFLQSHPRAGIAGSSFEIANGALWPHAFRFPSIWSELASGLRLSLVDALLKRRTVMMRMGDRDEQVDWLPGSSMLVRRAVFQDVGLMDEGYFLYFEETDFCLRAAKAGWECWYVPGSRVMHIAGQSTGVTGDHAAVKRRPGYWFESRRRYWITHHGWSGAAAVDLVWLLAHGLWRARNALQRKPSPYPPHYLRDFLHASALWNRAVPGNPRIATKVTQDAENCFDTSHV